MLMRLNWRSPGRMLQLRREERERLERRVKGVSSGEHGDTKRHFSFVICTVSACERMRGGGTSHDESGQLPIFLDNCLFSRVIRFMLGGRGGALCSVGT